MRSLSAHLAQPGDHGHLPFHPGCPVCCAERLSGPLPGDELVGQRPRALLAAALLAAATAAPTVPAIAPSVAVAQDESDDEGAGGGEEPERKGFGDEGGFEDAPESPLPADPGSPPATPPASPAPPPQPQATPIPMPLVSPTPGPGSDSTPPPAPDSDPGPVAPPSPRAVQPDGDRERSDAREKRASPGPSGRPRAPSAPPNGRVEPPAAPTPPQPATDAPPAAAPSAPPPSSVADAEAFKLGNAGASYRVQPGESLWSIAQARLGADAGPAAVARLVNRLWELNAGRIATGDPDLIMVGTLLRLP